MVIESKRTGTVELTDAQWIPIRPGTEGALALGLCNILIPINKDGLLQNPDVGPRLERDKYPLYINYREEAHAASLLEPVFNSYPYKFRSMIILGSSIITSWPNPGIRKKTIHELDFLFCINGCTPPIT
ncbi:MAG: hypothetical protein SV375_09175 [Thermodesulfobacteriota bacterium]|nr:hypothetical protein [Thermodesulfobacteriota bacterium]